MTLENYILYLNGTVEESYPLKTKKHINKLFVEKGVAIEKTQLSIDNITESGINVDELELTEKIKMCLSYNKKARSIFEEWEFEKDLQIFCCFYL